MARVEDIQVSKNLVCNVHLFHVFLFLRVLGPQRCAPRFSFGTIGVIDSIGVTYTHSSFSSETPAAVMRLGFFFAN